MTDIGDPKRWSEAGGDAPEAVRSVLEACRNDIGTDAELALLEAKLGPIVAPPAAPPPAPAPAPSGGEGVTAGLGKAYLIKAAAGLVIASGAVALFVALDGDEAPSGVAPRMAPSVVPRPLEAPVASVTSPQVLPLTPAAAGASASAPASPSSRGVAQPAPSEAELLGAAQAALGSSPARALSLLDEHRRRYSRGMMVQEREVMAIEALGRLGRKAEASARAERFLKAFPGSAHRARVQGLAVPGNAKTR